MTKKEIAEKLDVGRFVRIRFNDIGVVDGLVTEIDGKRLKIYCHYEHSTDIVERDQIVEIGPYLNVPKF